MMAGEFLESAGNRGVVESTGFRDTFLRIESGREKPFGVFDS
jgi:hypothetical protein